MKNNLKRITMFNQKSKSETKETVSGGSASIIAAGTSLKGDISSAGDIRIDGTLVGNIHCSAKVVIGAQGKVEGDIVGQQADIMGTVSGTVTVKELLQLKGGSNVNGNISAGKLQIEPSANFNGQCHMNQGNSPVETGNTEADPVLALG